MSKSSEICTKSSEYHGETNNIVKRNPNLGVCFPNQKVKDEQCVEMEDVEEEIELEKNHHENNTNTYESIEDTNHENYLDEKKTFDSFPTLSSSRKKLLYCVYCKKKFVRPKNLENHVKQKHNSNDLTKSRIVLKLKSQVLKGTNINHNKIDESYKKDDRSDSSSRNSDNNLKYKDPNIYGAEKELCEDQGGGGEREEEPPELCLVLSDTETSDEEGEEEQDHIKELITLPKATDDDEDMKVTKDQTNDNLDESENKDSKIESKQLWTTPTKQITASNEQTSEESEDPKIKRAAADQMLTLSPSKVLEHNW